MPAGSSITGALFLVAFGTSTGTFVELFRTFVGTLEVVKVFLVTVDACTLSCSLLVVLPLLADA